MLQIILVAFNNLNQVQRTLQSLELISMPFEVIIVDSSTDLLIRDYSSSIQEFKLRYFWEEKAGIYHAMNTGWKKCQSDDLIWYLNPGDCLLSGESLENLVRGIHTTGAAWGFAQAIPGKSANKIFPKSYAEVSPKALHKGVLSISHQTILVWQSELRLLMGFDERFKIAADLDIEFQLLKKQLPFFERSPLVEIETGGFSHQRVLRTLFESALVRKKNNLLSRPQACIWFINKITIKVFFKLQNRIVGHAN